MWAKFISFLKNLFAASVINAAPIQQPPPPPIVVQPTTTILAWAGKNKDAPLWTQTVLNLIRHSKLPDVQISDIQEFFPSYNSLSREQKIIAWAQLISKTVQYECDYNPADYSVDAGSASNRDSWSVGLLQMSVVDQANYGINFNYNFSDLQDGVKNLNLGVAIMEKLIAQDNKLQGQVNGKWKGLARYWGTLREGRKSFDGIKSYCLSIKFETAPSSSTSETPWMDWLKSHVGGNEDDKKFSDYMSQYWPLVGLPQFHDIQGAEHAWCALTANVALIQSGYLGNHNAAAVSFVNYGTACELKHGCIIVIQHPSGGHHVTFCDQIVGNGLVDCLGGNQSNQLKISRYDLSGNTDKIIATRWPVKA